MTLSFVSFKNRLVCPYALSIFCKSNIAGSVFIGTDIGMNTVSAMSDIYRILVHGMQLPTCVNNIIIMK